MGTVIGYKGTAANRRIEWLTLLALRQSIAASKSEGYNFMYRDIKKLYARDFTDYVKAA